MHECVCNGCAHTQPLHPPAHPPPLAPQCGVGDVGRPGQRLGSIPMCCLCLFPQPRFSNTPCSPFVAPPRDNALPTSPSIHPKHCRPHSPPYSEAKTPMTQHFPPPTELRGGREPPGKGINPMGCWIWGRGAVGGYEKELRAWDAGGGGCRMEGVGCGGRDAEHRDAGRTMAGGGISKDVGCRLAVEGRRMRDRMRDEG